MRCPGGIGEQCFFAKHAWAGLSGSVKRIDIGDYYADFGLIRSVLGWEPKVPLRKGLSRTLAFYREFLPHYL